MISIHSKIQTGVFEFFRFKERFLKASFSRRISVDGSMGLTVKIKLRSFKLGSGFRKYLPVILRDLLLKRKSRELSVQLEKY